LRELLIHNEEVKQLKRTKTYRNYLEEVDQMISFQMSQLHKLTAITKCVAEGREVKLDDKIDKERLKLREKLMKEVEQWVKDHPKNLSTKTGRKRKKSPARGKTYEETYALLREGLSVKEVADKRELAISTIEGHCARGIGEGELEISSFMDKAEMAEIEKAFAGKEEQNLKEIFAAMDGKYSFGKLRMVQAHLNKPAVKQ
jgi:uncharacterized protein YpbB